MTGDPLGDLVRAAGRRSSPPVEDYECVLAEARSAWQRKLRSRRRRARLLALAATIVLFAVGVTAFMHWMPRGLPENVGVVAVVRGTSAILIPGEDTWRPLHISANIPAGARVRTGAQGGVALKLAEGHSVRIDRQSELIAQSPERLRLAAGAVYVESGLRSQSSPVRIETGFGSVREIGTIFEVRIAADAVRVRVREGRVELAPRAGRDAVESAAGEEILLGSDGTLRRAAVPLSDATWAWAEALAAPPELEGKPLLQFLMWVSRETGRSLQFQDPAIEAQAREVIMHGKTRDLSPLEALDLMLSTTDLEYSLPDDDRIVIRQRPK